MADRHQPGEEGIPRLSAPDQQTSGAGAALAGGNKGGLDGQMHRGIDVPWVVNDQRIIAAHLQRKDLLRLPGQLAMQMKTGGRAAGKQQPIDVRLAAERLAGFPTALQQVEHAGGQASLLPQLHHRFAAVRG